MKSVQRYKCKCIATNLCINILQLIIVNKIGVRVRLILIICEMRVKERKNYMHVNSSYYNKYKKHSNTQCK